MRAVIKFHDDPYELATQVEINPNWTEDDDDPRVFYYFESKEEVELAKRPDPNGFEFQLIQIEETE